MDEGFWWKLYEFEFKHRSEINDNLRHTLQLSIAELAFVLYFFTNFIEKIIQYKQIATLCMWIVFALATISILLCAVGYTFFKTAFPNPAGELKHYKTALQQYDAENAEKMFSEFIHERWVENANKNAQRNKAKSTLSFWARMVLAASAIPLLISVICYLANRTCL